MDEGLAVSYVTAFRLHGSYIGKLNLLTFATLDGKESLIRHRMRDFARLHIAQWESLNLDISAVKSPSHLS